MTSSIFTEQYGRFRELLIQYRQRSSLTQVQLAQRLNRPQFNTYIVGISIDFITV